MTISFNDLKKLFDESWDVGIISADVLKRVSLMPIKDKSHIFGADFTNDIHFTGLTNTLILIKDGHTWDYTHYEEGCRIIKNAGYENWFPIYTNFKEAAIMSGLGVRARNSLIYSYKFGFDCHISAIGFEDEIIDLPTNKRVNNKLWKRCENCDDCIKACPVGAIHGTKEPYWLDSDACDTFIGFGNHPEIPSIKNFWHENIYPELPKDLVDSIQNGKDSQKIFGQFLPLNRNGFHYDGQVTRFNGEPVNVPFCRECTSQPRCSKWNGKFPYQKYKTIKILKEKNA